MRLLILVLLALPMASFGQTINGTALSEIETEYIQIVGTARLMSNKVTIKIDFGQFSQYFRKQGQDQIKDKDGKPVLFNSMIDALNFMSANGYEFVQAYALTVGSNNVYHYLMRKK